MSRCDYDKYADRIRDVIGEVCDVTMAPPSLKVRFDLVDHKRRYLWIEPPWEIVRENGESECSSESEESELIGPGVRGKCADLIRGKALVAIRCDDDGLVEFEFQGGVCILSWPPEPDGDEEEIEKYDDFFWRS